MTKRRFKELGSGSFFGDYVYRRAVPERHFSRQLDEVVDWEVFTAKLIRFYRGRAKRGRPPYDPVVILKMLLLSYLCDLSERQTEAYVNDSLSAKCFLGLAVDEAGPDHSTLTKFKGRIENRGNEALLEELLRDVIAMAMSKGVTFGSIQVVDSPHTVADINVRKDDHRKNEEKPRPDGDARWGVKGKKEGEGGSNSAIILNDYRTQKKDKNKQVWIDLKKTPQYRAGKRERYKIERKFGEAKAHHGLRRCRYVGRLRYAIQAYFTAIALNLKRMVKLLTGASFKGRAGAMA